MVWSFKKKVKRGCFRCFLMGFMLLMKYVRFKQLGKRKLGKYDVTIIGDALNEAVILSQSGVKTELISNLYNNKRGFNHAHSDCSSRR